MLNGWDINDIVFFCRTNESKVDILLIFDISLQGLAKCYYSPKMSSIPIDEVASVGIQWDVMSPTEHGGQHGVLKSPQRGQASGEVRAPDIQRDHLWKLYNGNGKTSWISVFKSSSNPFIIALVC